MTIDWHVARGPEVISASDTQTSSVDMLSGQLDAAETVLLKDHTSAD